MENKTKLKIISSILILLWIGVGILNFIQPNRYSIIIFTFMICFEIWWCFKLSNELYESHASHMQTLDLWNTSTNEHLRMLKAIREARECQQKPTEKTTQ